MTGAGGGPSRATSTSSPSIWTPTSRTPTWTSAAVGTFDSIRGSSSRRCARRSRRHRNRRAGGSGRASASGRSGTRSPRSSLTKVWRAPVRIFFATDIHGSDVCWRKFLNAGTFHKADVLVMGGDMTGKAMVPISVGNGHWRVTLQEQEHVLSSEDEVAAMEKRIRDRGYYPIRLTPDEFEAWKGDASLVDERFKHEMLAQVERWMALADERLAGKNIRCVVSPANDDVFEIDPIIDAAKLVDLG